MSKLQLYVYVNKRHLMKIHLRKTPRLYQYAEAHIDEMMAQLQADILSEKEKFDCPVRFVSLDKWNELCTGVKVKDIRSLTFCFGIDKVLCDIRIDPDQLKLIHLDKIKEGDDSKPQVIQVDFNKKN